MLSKTCLWVVATPIGNLQDISLRALEVLASVDLIAAEDTRRTGVLLKAHGITTPMTAYHEHNEKSKAVSLVTKLKDGKSIALVSDAGTPLISDPGYRLIRLAASESIVCSPVPGPCAAIAALSVSGQSAARFHFEGFLPAKSVARNNRLRQLREKPDTIILYESGHRIIACLKAVAEILGADREMTVCRELTKQFETLLRGGAAQVLHMVQQDTMQQKGEFVLVIGGRPEVAESIEISQQAQSCSNCCPRSYRPAKRRALQPATQASPERRYMPCVGLISIPVGPRMQWEPARQSLLACT